MLPIQNNSFYKKPQHISQINGYYSSNPINFIIDKICSLISALYSPLRSDNQQKKLKKNISLAPQPSQAVFLAAKSLNPNSASTYGAKVLKLFENSKSEKEAFQIQFDPKKLSIEERNKLVEILIDKGYEKTVRSFLGQSDTKKTEIINHLLGISKSDEEALLITEDKKFNSNLVSFRTLIFLLEAQYDKTLQAIFSHPSYSNHIPLEDVLFECLDQGNIIAAVSLLRLSSQCGVKLDTHTVYKACNSKQRSSLFKTTNQYRKELLINLFALCVKLEDYQQASQYYKEALQRGASLSDLIDCADNEKYQTWWTKCGRRIAQEAFETSASQPETFDPDGLLAPDLPDDNEMTTKGAIIDEDDTPLPPVAPFKAPQLAVQISDLHNNDNGNNAPIFIENEDETPYIAGKDSLKTPQPQIKEDFVFDPDDIVPDEPLPEEMN